MILKESYSYVILTVKRKAYKKTIVRENEITNLLNIET